MNAVIEAQNRKYLERGIRWRRHIVGGNRSSGSEIQVEVMMVSKKRRGERERGREGEG